MLPFPGLDNKLQHCVERGCVINKQVSSQIGTVSSMPLLRGYPAWDVPHSHVFCRTKSSAAVLSFLALGKFLAVQPQRLEVRFESGRTEHLMVTLYSLALFYS